MPTVAIVFLIVLAAGAFVVAVHRARRPSAGRTAFVDLDALRKLSWNELEILVADYFVREGFVVRDQGGKTIDFLMEKNGERWLVQCKHWRNKKIGEAEVRDVFGHVAALKARGAFLLTIGSYTKAALQFASGKRIELIDGPGLARMVEEVQQDPSEITRSRLDAVRDAERTQPRRVILCPRCGRPMARRLDRRAGRDFYGCSRYPTCKGRREIA